MFNVPKLRFREFEGEWVEKRLDEISQYTKGFAFKSNEYSNSGIRIVRVSDLGIDLIKNDKKIYIEEDNEDSYLKYKIQKDNIIITTVGSNPDLLESAVGRAIYIKNNNEGLLNQNMLKLENNNQVNNKFIHAQINSPKYIHHIRAIKRGNANQANITVKELLKFKIYVTSKPEQQKIANFLTSIDQKIEQLTKKEKLLVAYKKGVMQKIFSRQIQFQDENGEVYGDWVERKLGEISKRKTIKNKESKVNKVLTNSATKGIVSQQDYFDKDIANKNNLEGYYVVDIDDFVYNPRISIHAPVGPIKRNNLSLGVMSPLYTVFKFHDVNLDFMESFFTTTIWHKYMNTIANFGARHDRMNITNKDFLEMPIMIPEEEEQTKIANFLLSIDKKIEQVKRQIEESKGFKKGLLQEMFV